MAYKKNTINPEGRILIKVTCVPNYNEIKKMLTDNSPTNTVPKKEDILACAEKMQSSTMFLPVNYQKIVSMTMIHNTIGYKEAKAANPDCEIRPWTISNFTGDEAIILKNFWSTYNKLCSEFAVPDKYNKGHTIPGWPSIITCDRKKGTIPLIVNRSYILLQILTKKAISLTGMMPDEILAAGNKPDNPQYSIMTRFWCVKTGLKDFMTKDDKWEDSRPNYLNTYSNYTPDMANDFSLHGAEEAELTAVLNMVRENKWEELSKYTTAAAIRDFEHYALSRYINYDEKFYKDCVNEAYLSDPSMASYQINKPSEKLHPFYVLSDTNDVAKIQDIQDNEIKEESKVREPIVVNRKSKKPKTTEITRATNRILPLTEKDISDENVEPALW